MIRLLLALSVVACSISLPLYANNTELQPEADTGLSQLKSGVADEYMVVTANPLASDAAKAILAAGGSAVDAAITAQLVLTLVEPQSSGIGGGAFLMHYQASDKQIEFWDGRETAPAAIDSNHFLEQDGQPMKFWDALVGGHSVGTPGVLAMLEAAHRKHGKLPWAQLFNTPIQLSKQGFSVSPRLHQLLVKTPHMKVNPAIQSYFYQSNGEAWPVGHILKNPSYAKTLQSISDEGTSVFYKGALAEDIVKAVQTDPVRPGLLSLSDLARYEPIQRKPSCLEIRTNLICSAPPPSSGGITTLQTLKILEQLDHTYSGPLDSRFAHDFSAALNLSFADRNKYIADPEFVNVPEAQMLDINYLSQRASLITDQALVKAQAGQFQLNGQRLTYATPEQPSTSHLSIVDRWGNGVSMTTTIEMGFGSRVMVGGFILNNQLTDFNFQPRDERSHWVANRVEPLKRPRSSMSPSLVLDSDRNLKILIGSPGGSRIIAYTSQALANLLWFNLSPAEAVSVPHITARNTGVVEIETSRDSDRLKEDLEVMGYRVKVGAQNSGLHAIERQGESWVGGADPRREGTVEGR